MENVIKIPPLNWFESNPWAKVGNQFTGSVGAVSIQNNAFLFRINFYRKDEGPILVAESYDSISELDKSVTEYETKQFDGTEKGREEMINWLENQYNEFVSSKKANKKIEF